jgi:glycosyltransferase involved in cell wall biosynthesis
MDMKYRILIGAYACLVSPEVEVPGGGDLMAWNLVNCLGRVHRLWVLTAAQNRKAIEAAFRENPLPNVQFVYVGLPRWLHVLMGYQVWLQLYAYLWQWKAYFVARRHHRTVRFDLYHHLTYENDWMASIIGALLPVPYVRGPGGGAHRIPKEFLKGFRRGSRLAEFRRSFGQWVFRHDPFFIWSQHRARVILACNREAVEGVPARWRDKVQLLSVNGISRHELAPPQQPVRSEKFAVLSAGRLVPLKGFDLALRAFAIFAKRHPEAGFTIIGKGPEQNRLEGLIHQLGIEKQARIERWMPREHLLASMRSCDVFLFASLRDGGGLVVVEAMAAGKPVICLDLGGPGLHVTEECGIKVPAHSPDEAIELMAQALEKLYQDRDRRVKMGQAARTRAEQVYIWDQLGERLLKIYNDVLGAPSPEA